MKKHKFLLLGVVVVLYALMVIPLMVINQQSRQDIRSRADSTPTENGLLASYFTNTTLTGSPTTTRIDSTVDLSTADDSVTNLQLPPGLSKNHSIRWTGFVVPKYSQTYEFRTWTNGGIKVWVNDQLIIDRWIAVALGQSRGGTIPLIAGQKYSIRVEYFNVNDLPFINLFWSCPSQLKEIIPNANLFTSHVSPTNIPNITPAPASNVCSTDSPADIAIVIDRSGSMNDKTNGGFSGTKKIDGAKKAANTFLDILAQNTQNQSNLVTYESTASLDSPLTNNYSFLKSKITAIIANGGTCIECGIKKANADLATNGRSNIKKVVVLLTDGKANFIEGNSHEQSTSLAEQKALAAAIAGHKTKGTIFFTIGLGNDVNAGFLKELAAQTGGQYYFPPSIEGLTAIYAEISQIIAQGAVSGTIFKDANRNAIKDQNEQKLSDWTMQLTSSSSGQIKTATTDNDGYFSITGVCDGSYALKPFIKSGWTQTLPASGAAYPITITNGNAVTDKDFGVTQGARCSDTIDNDTNGFTDAADSTCHTDGNPKNSSSYDPNKDGENGGGNTCADSKDNNNNGLIDGGDPVCHTDGNPDNPTSYDPNRPESFQSLTLDLILHGVGAGGDNANPIENSLSNKNPLHKIRFADVFVYGTGNQLIASGSSTVTYNSTGGHFTGKIPLNASLTPGKYTVRVGTERYLRRFIKDIQTLTGEANQTLPSVELIAGDIDNNNKINILDYNMLLDCYSDLVDASAKCSTQKKTAADINDDGSVNQADYNLFLREILTQPGG